MNELKPEDVMEEAECCGYATGCTDCVLAKYDGSPCIVKKALALLREKDALIEALTMEKEDLEAELAQAYDLFKEDEAEIERLTANMNGYAFTTQTLSKEFEDYRADVQMEIADARAEAITEFAQRLKTFYKHLPGNTVGGSVEYHIDQIAKEMREQYEG